MSNKKFSEFVEGVQCRVGDIIVGLRSTTNYKFIFPSDGIQDVDGNYLFKYDTAGIGAVNWIELQNSGPGSPVRIEAGGSDTNIDLTVEPKGSGAINLNSESVLIEAQIQHFGNTDNFIAFGTDTQDYQTSGSSRLDISDSGVRFGGANSRITTTLDEDNMASDSDTALATQQSIKAYIDSALTVSAFSKAARVATTTNLAATYANGASGVGATLTASANGAAVIDGISVLTGEEVLFKDQSTAFQNGIYTLTTNGTAGTPSIFTRWTVFDEVSEMVFGELVGIVEGTVNGQTLWQLMSDVSTVGTDALDFQNLVITRPSSSTDDALVTWDGTTGRIIQDSVAILTGAGALSGLTQLDVDNIRIDGNTVSSTDVNGSVILDPNGTGLIDLSSDSVLVGAAISHSGDLTNFINFGTLTQDFQIGGSIMDLAATGVRFGGADARITSTLDEDNMASDSDTALATQQSIKAYVDAGVSSAIPTIGASTDNAAVRWDGATGGIVQDSVVIIDDVGVITGVTQLNVDNIRIDGNTISSTDAAGNVDIDLDTTGEFTINGSTAGITDILDEDNMSSDSETALATQQSIKAYVDAVAALVFTWNSVAGTTQAAAVNNGYIIDNAGATTVTLPATAAIGSIVAVQGKGAAGWILAANTGQTIQLGSSATSSAGSLTSANQWDAIEVVCVTANTTWATRFVYSAGLTIA